MKHKSLLFIISILLISFLSTCSVYSENNLSLNIRVDLGYKGVGIINSHNPIEVRLENRGDDIRGELQLSEGNDNGVVYSCGISLGKGVTKIYKLSMPVNSLKKGIRVSVCDENGASKSNIFYFTTFVAHQSPIMAMVHSQDFMEHFNGAKKGQKLIKFVAVDEQALPSERQTLKAFDYILISDSDLGMLNDAQIDSLFNWVLEGGVLISNGDGNSPVLEGILQRSKSSKIINSLKSSVSAQINRVGLGSFVALSVDPWASASEDNKTFIDLFSHISNQSQGGFERVNDQDNYTKERKFEYKELNYYLPEGDNSPIIVLVIILAIYIFLVIPGVYLLLKAAKKSILSWVLLPAIALMFAFVIYMSGSSTRLNKPILNNHNVVFVDNAHEIMNVEMNMAAINNGSGMINLKPNENIDLAPEKYSPYFNVVENPNINLGCKFIESEGLSCEMKGKGIWEATGFTGTYTIPLSKPLLSDFSMTDGQIHLQINNNTPYDFHSCFLVLGKKYCLLGDIAKGKLQEFSSTKGGDKWMNDFDQLVNHFDEKSKLFLREFNDKHMNLFNSDKKIYFVAQNYDPSEIKFTMNGVEPIVYDSKIIYSSVQ